MMAIQDRLDLVQCRLRFIVLNSEATKLLIELGVSKLNSRIPRALHPFTEIDPFLDRIDLGEPVTVLACFVVFAYPEGMLDLVTGKRAITIRVSFVVVPVPVHK